MMEEEERERERYREGEYLKLTKKEDTMTQKKREREGERRNEEISMKRLRERELDEHEARITQLMNELHEYALRHGYSDLDLYDAAYAFTVETLSLLSKRDAREILRKLEEGAYGLREMLKKNVDARTRRKRKGRRGHSLHIHMESE